jgi:hypothetical protein
MIRSSSSYTCFQKRIILSLILIGSFVVPVQAETKSHKLWRISAIVLASASIADASTSWNQREGNPLLRNANGQFGGKAFAIKGALVGSTLLSQYMFMKKKPEMEKVNTTVNFGAAAIFGAVAAHNMSVRSK